MRRRGIVNKFNRKNLIGCLITNLKEGYIRRRKLIIKGRVIIDGRVVVNRRIVANIRIIVNRKVVKVTL